MATQVSVTWEVLLQMVAAAGALGTASFGLVDVSKALRRGLPSAGFGHLDKVFSALPTTLERALAGPDWRDHLRSYWIGGMPKEEQKAIVRSLVRLGFSAEPAVIDELTAFAGVEAARLTAIAAKLERGAALAEKDINVLGRLDATLDARIDAAYERADHAYRSAARASAAVVAVTLAFAASLVMGFPMGGTQMWLALALGVVAVPLAPIAKDISKAVSAAAKLGGAVKGAG